MTPCYEMSFRLYQPSLLVYGSSRVIANGVWVFFDGSIANEFSRDWLEPLMWVGYR